MAKMPSQRTPVRPELHVYVTLKNGQQAMWQITEHALTKLEQLRSSELSCDDICARWLEHKGSEQICGIRVLGHRADGRPIDLNVRSD